MKRCAAAAFKRCSKFHQIKRKRKRKEKMNKTVINYRNVSHVHYHEHNVSHVHHHEHVELESYTLEYVISASIIIALIIVGIIIVKALKIMKKRRNINTGVDNENIQLYG